MEKTNALEPNVEWGDYTRLEPGTYQAYCNLAKWYQDPGFKRWTCILKFDVMAANLTDSLGTIPIWFNGGDNDVPHAGRRSRYFAAWVSAKGGPPARKDRLSPSVLIRRMALVLVGDTKGINPYSVVREILNWHTG